MTDASLSDGGVKLQVQVSPVNSGGGQTRPGSQGHTPGDGEEGRAPACERGGRVNSEVIEAGLL